MDFASNNAALAEQLRALQQTNTRCRVRYRAHFDIGWRLAFGPHDCRRTEFKQLHQALALMVPLTRALRAYLQANQSLDTRFKWALRVQRHMARLRRLLLGGVSQKSVLMAYFGELSLPEPDAQNGIVRPGATLAARWDAFEAVVIEKQQRDQALQREFLDSLTPQQRSLCRELALRGAWISAGAAAKHREPGAC